MKRYLLSIILVSFCIGSFAQRTNSKGQYMVKTATWKTYGSGDGSYRMDLDYYKNGQLKKIVKSYTHHTRKYVETYSISYNSKGEKSLNCVRLINGKRDNETKMSYLFNEDGVISHINWYVPSENNFVNTFQMFYDENEQLVKMIENYGENMGKTSCGETITQINWENGNIVSDRVIRNNDTEFYTGEDFVYYPESQVRNNTNLNFHNLVMHSVGRDYTSDIVMGTEWFGKNTDLILKGTKWGLKDYGRYESKNIDHYEYKLNGDLITELRYIAPHILAETDTGLFGTLTLEYLY